MKHLLLLITGLSFFLHQAEGSPIPKESAESITSQSLPQKFYVKQRWFSWTVGFDITTPKERLGSVYRAFPSLRVQYDFYNAKDLLSATARMRWFTWGAVFDLFDYKEGVLGRVEERVFTCFPTFDIYNQEGTWVATAKRNFWATKYTLKDPASRLVIATLSRPFFRLKDNWTVSLLRPEYFENQRIDPRLFITVMAFQTDSDYWKSDEWHCSYITKIEESSFQKVVALVEERFDEEEEGEGEEKQEERIAFLEQLSKNTLLTENERDAANFFFLERCKDFLNYKK